MSVPSGVHRGHHLAWLEHPEARRKRWRWPQRVGFEWAPWGVDFDRRLWFFFRQSLAAGRFTPQIERSRWHETQAVALHYEVSRLPGPLRGLLYDEVKPLDERWMVGIGGMQLGPRRGDHFLFALERLDPIRR